jgi:hypothetical protein
MRAAPGHPLVRWYSTGHSMDTRSMEDMVAWQAQELR